MSTASSTLRQISKPLSKCRRKLDLDPPPPNPGLLAKCLQSELAGWDGTSVPSFLPPADLIGSQGCSVEEEVWGGPFGKAQKRDCAALWLFWPISPDSSSTVRARALRWAIPSTFSQDLLLQFKHMAKKCVKPVSLCICGGVHKLGQGPHSLPVCVLSGTSCSSAWGRVGKRPWGQISALPFTELCDHWRIT